MTISQLHPDGPHHSVPQKLIFMALGSNLGDRARNLENALDRLEAGEVRVLVLIARSMKSAPAGIPRDQPWFLNQVLKAETNLFPLQLLRLTQRIEREMGRERGPAAIPKGPRLIDIDILLFGQAAIDTPQLVMPPASGHARSKRVRAGAVGRNRTRPATPGDRKVVRERAAAGQEPAGSAMASLRPVAQPSGCGCSCGIAG